MVVAITAITTILKPVRITLMATLTLIPTRNPTQILPEIRAKHPSPARRRIQPARLR